DCCGATCCGAACGGSQSTCCGADAGTSAVDESCSCSFADSFLKIRMASPIDLAALGSFAEPKSTTSTTRMMSKCVGLSKSPIVPLSLSARKLPPRHWDTRQAHGTPRPHVTHPGTGAALPSGVSVLYAARAAA